MSNKNTSTKTKTVLDLKTIEILLITSCSLEINLLNSTPIKTIYKVFPRLWNETGINKSALIQTKENSKRKNSIEITGLFQCYMNDWHEYKQTREFKIITFHYVLLRRIFTKPICFASFFCILELSGRRQSAILWIQFSFCCHQITNLHLFKVRHYGWGGNRWSM